MLAYSQRPIPLLERSLAKYTTTQVKCQTAKTDAYVIYFLPRLLANRDRAQKSIQHGGGTWAVHCPIYLHYI